jgi:hypothetical protein
MTLNSDTTRRLAQIRLLLNRAEHDSSQSMPFAMDCVNRLHDATEMFLALAVQVHNKAIPRSFLDYWEQLEPVLQRPLSYKAQMKRFNSLRVNLKHYGNEPSEQDISWSVVTVQAFLADECLSLFGVDLDNVSLSNFVRHERSKELVEQAEVQWGASNETEAFADLAEAFDELLLDYSARKRLTFRNSSFDVTSSLRRYLRDAPFKEWKNEARLMNATVYSIVAIDAKVTMSGVGIDLRRYGRFESLTPYVTPQGNGQRRVQDGKDLKRSQKDFEFCRDFVIASAVRLAEFDYDSSPREAPRQ